MDRVIQQADANMSVANALLSLILWTAVFSWADWVYVEIFYYVIFSAQIVLLLCAGRRVYSGHDFSRWLRRGGVVADHRRGIHSDFRFKMPALFESWVAQHEEMEALVARAFGFNRLPFIGPLINHLVTSLSDPLSLLYVSISLSLNKARFVALRSPVSRFLYAPLTAVDNVWQRRRGDYFDFPDVGDGCDAKSI
jgi:hypothetical protein